MRLTSLEYAEYKGLPDEWIAGPIQFGPINLIVGKNSSGKSRLLNVTNALAQLVSGRRQILSTGHFKVDFIDDSKPRKSRRVQYELLHEDSRVAVERFSINGERLLQRKGPRGQIKAVQLKKVISFEAPEGALAAVVRRDNVQHPFFESLYGWGASLKHYLFGSDFGKTNLAMFDESGPGQSKSGQSLVFEQKQVVNIYKQAKKRFGAKLDRAILADMKTMGYPCQEVGLMTVPGVQGTRIPVWQLYLKERDLRCRTSQLNMSQGMFRALALTLQLNVSALGKSMDCVLIDDVGEGLDFDRASRLISLLIEKAEKAHFQLIMTTNDRFVMNSVPLKYWQVLVRNKNMVEVLNERNSSALFKDFEFTGLSNFDFFKNTLSSK